MTEETTKASVSWRNRGCCLSEAHMITVHPLGETPRASEASLLRVVISGEQASEKVGHRALLWEI